MANILSYRIGYVSQPQLPLDRTAKIGIKHLEIVMAEGETVPDVLRTLEPHGLRVATLSAPMPLAEDSLYHQLADYADRAAALGALGLYTSAHAGDMPREEAYDRLRKVGDIAAARGLFIALETHPDLCENGTKAAETLSAINHPALAWNCDAANLYYYNENIDAVEEVKKAARFIRSLHAKDTMGGFHDPSFPNLGEGIVDYAGIGEVLRSVGFSGPYTLELEGIAGSADSVEKMEANVAACAGHLRGLGLVD